MSNSLAILTSELPFDRSKNVSSLPSSNKAEQFLRLHLIPDTTALLPIQQLTEVLTIPIGQIVPIAHIPSWVMGVYNWRGEILWMVDLGHRIGLPPWYEQKSGISTHTAVVLNISSDHRTSTNIKSQMLGLVVNRVEDIEWCNPNSIQSPPAAAVTPEIAPFLRGYWLKSTGEMLTLLDGKAIMSGMPKA